MSSVDTIKELMSLMNKHKFASLELKEDNFAVKLEKYPRGSAAAVAAAPMAMPSVPAPVAPAPETSTSTSPADTDMTGLTPVKSPIVGTFYGSPSPDSAPFVAVGDKVSPDSIVCIIEAMKIMNEIKAEVGGTVEKVLVENGDPVEYGQPLFLVRK